MGPCVSAEVAGFHGVHVHDWHHRLWHRPAWNHARDLRCIWEDLYEVFMVETYMVALKPLILRSRSEDITGDSYEVPVVLNDILACSLSFSDPIHRTLGQNQKKS